MIDDFAILLTHVLLGVACWRLMARDDLDFDPAPAPAPAIEQASAEPAPTPAPRPAVPALQPGGGRRA